MNYTAIVKIPVSSANIGKIKKKYWSAVPAIEALGIMISTTITIGSIAPSIM
jgi:hypothetical protein